GLGGCVPDKQPKTPGPLTVSITSAANFSLLKIFVFDINGNLAAADDLTTKPAWAVAATSLTAQIQLATSVGGVTTYLGNGDLPPGTYMVGLWLDTNTDSLPDKSYAGGVIINGPTTLTLDDTKTKSLGLGEKVYIQHNGVYAGKQAVCVFHLPGQDPVNDISTWWSVSAPITLDGTNSLFTTHFPPPGIVYDISCYIKNAGTYTNPPSPPLATSGDYKLTITSYQPGPGSVTASNPVIIP
ncbi:MAG: hypothetical protein OEW12_03975, partial [Deltaproteobacteria bacterium]|nr:hypothetical protein [Deltaproteobacteria bacterium]